MKNCRFYATLGAMVLPLALFSSGAGAQNAPTPRTIYLYNAALGTSLANVNAAKTAPWGNGAVINARDMDYEGAPVLRLTTRNLQEGVRFDLTTPTDLEPYRANGFLRLRLRFRETAPPALPVAPVEGAALQKPRVGTNFQIQPSWRGAAQFGGALPPIGGFGGAPAPGAEGNPEGAPPELPPVQKSPITEFGVTLVRENGVMAGRIPVSIETRAPDEGGWRLFVLPLKEMTSTPNASGPVKSLILTSDAADSFYLAQAALVVETGQMTVSIRRPVDAPGAQMGEIQVKPGPLTLIADVEAGAADPSVEWSFDADNEGNLPPSPLAGVPLAGAVPAPAANGPRLDARGVTATFTYPNEEQNYRVEVTVRDRSGLKKPVTASILVRVRG